MKKKQLFTMVGALALVGALGIGSTLAFLTAQSETVTNTFTVGKDLNQNDVKLDEAVWVNRYFDEKENVWVEATVNVEAQRTTENTYNDLEMGDVLYKDPTLHIDANTADSYVFVKITGLDALEAAGIHTFDALKSDGATADVTGINTDWKKLVDDGKLDGVYYYGASESKIVETSSDVVNLPALFHYLVVDNKEVNFFDKDGNPITLDKVVVEGCLVQAKNVTWEEAQKLCSFPSDN